VKIDKFLKMNKLPIDVKQGNKVWNIEMPKIWTRIVNHLGERSRSV